MVLIENIHGATAASLECSLTSACKAPKWSHELAVQRIVH